MECGLGLHGFMLGSYLIQIELVVCGLWMNITRIHLQLVEFVVIQVKISDHAYKQKDAAAVYSQHEIKTMKIKIGASSTDISLFLVIK